MQHLMMGWKEIAGGKNNNQQKHTLVRRIRGESCKVIMLYHICGGKEE
jgi:hypothetical protein